MRPRIDTDCRTGEGFVLGANIRPGAYGCSGQDTRARPAPGIDAELSRILSTHPIASAEGIAALAELRQRAEGLVRR